MATITQLREFMHSDVDVEKLIDQLVIDPDRLEKASIRQPKLMMDAGKVYVQAIARVKDLERRRDARAAQVGLKFRGKKDGVGKKQYTESAISHLISSDKKMMRLRKKLDEAFAFESLCKVMLEAFRHRRDTLRNLADIYSTEVSNEIRAVKNKIAVDDMRSKADKVRRRLRHEDESD